jgi:hypothetical protein
MAIYLTLGVLFAIPVLIKLWHLRAPLEIAPGSPPHFGGRMSGATVESFTGVVEGSSTRSDTAIYGQTQDGSGLMRSHTTVTNEFRLVDPQTHQERNNQVQQMHLQLHDGQIASVVWVYPKGKTSGRCLMVINHTSAQRFFDPETLRRIYGVGNPIVFALYAVVNFWNLLAWVLIPLWLVGFKRREKTFMRSGVDSLAMSLNENAARLTPA